MNALAFRDWFHQKINSNSGGADNTEDIPNLDFLRACAVLLVLCHHLLLFFQANTYSGPLKLYYIGQWGVLIFFVHTSLVLSLSLERQARRAPGQGLFWPFLVRRVFRILPLSILIVCVVECFGLPVGHIRDGHFVATHLKLPGLLSNIFLVQNITRQDQATAPLWSLPYEMQMYLLLPALFLLVRSARPVLPMTCLWLVGFVALLHEAGFSRHGMPDQLCYVPYFMPGIMAYKFMAVSKIRLPSILWPVVLAGITAFCLHNPSDRRGAICCLLLGVAIPHFAQISQPIVAKISQQIARYSYGIYLTHLICIWLSFQVLHGLPRSGQWVVLLLSVSMIPYLLYHLVEAPMIRYGRSVALRLNKCPNSQL
jgi:peptidoglycan/LPS O-acetylase OafA/YrhL